MFYGSCESSRIRKERLDWSAKIQPTPEDEVLKQLIEEYTRNHPEKPNGIYCGVLPISKIKVNKLNWESHEE